MSVPFNQFEHCTQMKTVNIQITDAAKMHFAALIQEEAVPEMGLRIFLDQPGMPTAEVGISFCPPGDQKGTDLIIPHDVFILYVDKLSAPYLEDAHIDFKTDELGGQLAVTAPNLRGHKPTNDAPLADKVTHILETEVNPNLAHHGGRVTLIEVTPHNEVILQFGGGCHGCGMVDVTLKHGIEKSLKAQLPEITAIKDVTDHTTGDNPYY